jgi:hypothetical protein
MGVSPEEEGQIVTRERLRILAWGCYIHGGFTAAMMSFFLLPFLFMMITTSTIPASQWNKPTPAAPTNYSGLPTPSATPAVAAEPPPKVFFAIFAAVFGAIILANVTLAALTIYAGRCIQQRKHKILIYIVAMINCLFIPYGTLLGVFMILVLSSPAGEAEFKRLSDQGSD